MPKPACISANEARNRLRDLLAAAEKGRATIITKHGRPVAALVPVDDFDATRNQRSLVSLRGSGKGLWGSDSAKTIAKMRNEWNR